METPNTRHLVAARELGESIDAYLATSQPRKVQRLGGEPLSGQRSGDEPGTSEIFLVTFDGGGQAFFKPVDGVDEDTASYYDATPESVAVAEVAAVAIARQLGSPYAGMVSSTVLRELDGRLGTLCWRLEGAVCPPHAIPQEQVFAAGLLDSLIGNQDRHMGNYFYDRAARRIALFDHGFSLCLPGAFINASYLLGARVGAGAAALTDEELATIAAVDLGVVDAMLAADRRAALHARLEHMRESAMVFDLEGDETGDADTTTNFTEETT